jgi:RHS repeat-associated protein
LASQGDSRVSEPPRPGTAATAGTTTGPTGSSTWGGSVIGHHVGLPGNATYTATAAGGLYRHANAHGDTITTTGASGEQVWAGHHGPYGETPTPEPADGTTTVPNTSWGWHGHQARLTDNNIIHMGARPYHPTLGRFLQVDPIEGGCANDYTYVRGDPINSADLNGEGCPGFIKQAASFLGWRFAFTAADRFFIDGDVGGALQALTGGYGTAITKGASKAKPPPGKHFVPRQGLSKVLGIFGSAAAKVAGGPVSVGATLADYSCESYDFLRNVRWSS